MKQRQSFMKIASPIIILGFMILGCDNSKINSKETYIEETKSFLNSEKADDTLIVDSEPYLFDKKDCIKYILNDSVNFTEDDVAEIIRQVKNPQIDKWSDAFFENGKVIDSDTISGIFEDSSKGWPYFEKIIGKRFVKISAPIFLRNYTYCLFYLESDCGELCGHGSVTLLKKEKEKWTFIKSYCPWIS